eukprot:3908917-Amphidinium_carterae.2
MTIDVHGCHGILLQTWRWRNDGFSWQPEPSERTRMSPVVDVRQQTALTLAAISSKAIQSLPQPTLPPVQPSVAWQVVRKGKCILVPTGVIDHPVDTTEMLCCWHRNR